jgi:hypothetical protein
MVIRFPISVRWLNHSEFDREIGGKSMLVDGGCKCGHIQYEAEVDPEKAVICHCTDCQVHGATAFGLVVGVMEGGFRLLSGKLKIYVKTAESGNKRAQAFCPECGTRIHASNAGDGDGPFSLRLGTVRQRDRLPPKKQIWRRSALSWIKDLEDIPSFDHQPKL